MIRILTILLCVFTTVAFAQTDEDLSKQYIQYMNSLPQNGSAKLPSNYEEMRDAHDRILNAATVADRRDHPSEPIDGTGHYAQRAGGWASVNRVENDKALGHIGTDHQRGWSDAEWNLDGTVRGWSSKYDLMKKMSAEDEQKRSADKNWWPQAWR